MGLLNLPMAAGQPSTARARKRSNCNDARQPAPADRTQSHARLQPQFAYLNANCAFHRPTRMLFRHMDFDCLRAFVWTLEEGGVSSAARRLNRTQPAVTRMLQTLEDHLGAQLIDRKARPMRPTTAGLKVLEHALYDLERGGTAHRWSRSSAAASQTLRVGVSRQPVVGHLRDGRFVNPQPPLSATDFFVRSGWSPRLYRRFVRGELDCAVVLMPTARAPDVPYKGGVVRSENLDLIGLRGPHEPARRSMSCEELDSQPWILNPSRMRVPRGALESTGKLRQAPAHSIRGRRRSSGASRNGRRGKRQ